MFPISAEVILNISSTTIPFDNSPEEINSPRLLKVIPVKNTEKIFKCNNKKSLFISEETNNIEEKPKPKGK